LFWVLIQRAQILQSITLSSLPFQHASHAGCELSPATTLPGVALLLSTGMEPRGTLHGAQKNGKPENKLGGEQQFHQTVEFDIVCFGCSSACSDTPVHNFVITLISRQHYALAGPRNKRGRCDQSPRHGTHRSGLHGLHVCVTRIRLSVDLCCMDHHLTPYANNMCLGLQNDRS
jgi:hypothetical protein